jgi:cytidylate kinase
LTDSLPEPAARWVEEQLAALGNSGTEMNPNIVPVARVALSLGSQGHVILIGRGAGFLLPQPSTLHVRLVAPLEDRIAYMSQWLRLTLEEARQRVRVRDARRAEFHTNYLQRQPGDIHGYDLVLNTSSLGEELCADLIIQAARAREAQFLETSDSLPPGVPEQ